MYKEMKTDFRPAYIKDFEACWNIIDQARRSMIPLAATNGPATILPNTT